MADNANGHGQRGHSPIGPSAAHRWTHCAVSVPRSRHVKNKDTVFTREGTAAHEFVEHIMTTRMEPERFKGGVIDLDGKTPERRFRTKSTRTGIEPDDWTTWRIDEDMVEGAELYRDTIDSYRVWGVRENGEPADEITLVMFETKLDMRHIHPNFYGTGDCIIYDRRTLHLVVCDYKYGRGYAVGAEDNEQLLSYALGAVKLLRDQGRRVETIETVIVQPRAYHHDGPVRKGSIDAFDLRTFEDWIRARAAETDVEDGVAHPGDQCKWCPVSYSCAELKGYIDDAIGAAWGPEITDDALPSPKRMTPDELGRVMRQRVVIENWLRAVAIHAHEEAVAGRLPTGMKIVDKRAYRRWVDPEAVIADLDLMGIDERDYMTDPEPELRSPAQMEKLLGKKTAKPLLERLSRKQSSGFVLALIEDARPAVKVDHSDAFGAVEDD